MFDDVSKIDFVQKNDEHLDTSRSIEKPICQRLWPKWIELAFGLSRVRAE